MKDAPLFTEADDKRNEAAVHATVAKLQRISDTDGVTTMLAEAMGMMWGIAHVFRTLGLQEMHRQMRKSLQDYMRGK